MLHTSIMQCRDWRYAGLDCRRRQATSSTAVKEDKLSPTMCICFAHAYLFLDLPRSLSSDQILFHILPTSPTNLGDEALQASLPYPATLLCEHQ